MATTREQESNCVRKTGWQRGETETCLNPGGEIDGDRGCR